MTAGKVDLARFFNRPLGAEGAEDLLFSGEQDGGYIFNVQY